MQILIGAICFFIFFYSLYILAKDDYILLRKNLILEQLFDFTFISLFFGLIVARIISVFFHPISGQNFILQVFTSKVTIFTMTGVVTGCIVAFYLIGRYRRLPIGLLFDFLTLSLLSSLSVWYLLNLFFIKTGVFIYYLIPGIFYLIISVIFWIYLRPRVISFKLKEGSLSSIFLLIFSFTSFLTSLFYNSSGLYTWYGREELVLIGLFLSSIIFLLRNEVRHKKIKHRK